MRRPEYEDIYIGVMGGRKSGTDIVEAFRAGHSPSVTEPDTNKFMQTWDKPTSEVAVQALVGAESVYQLLP